MTMIEKRKVDNKGRVSLPIKRKNEIYFLKKGKTFILSEDLNSLQEIAHKFEETRLSSKLQALKEWFEIVGETDLEKLSAKKMDRLIGEDISRKIKKSGELLNE